MNAIATKLQSLINPDGICAWENLDIQQQQRFQSAIAPGYFPECIVYPSTSTELTQIITMAQAQGWQVLPCGHGSKINWGGLVTPETKKLIVVSTQRLNNLIAHAVGDLTVTVAAGMKLTELQKILGSANQFLALDPTVSETATIGGIVATGDSGSLRQRYGGVRDQLIGFSFVRADGKIAKAGGRVVKNVAGYDLMKLFIGSYGTLGILSELTFRVYPLPSASQTVVLTQKSDAIAQMTKTLLASTLTPTVIDLLSPQLGSNLGFGLGISLVIRCQGIAESVQEQANRVVEIGKKLGLSVQTLSNTDETNLWQKLSAEIDSRDGIILSKIGIMPVKAVDILNQVDTLFPQGGIGLIHANSGLGKLRLASEQGREGLAKLRSYCESNGGFLTILTAPLAIKQELDVWGYYGNALDIMRQIKYQFDPESIFSPHRFVGGI